MTASSMQSWKLEGAGRHPAISQSAGDVQSNDMNLLQSRHDMFRGNPFPAAYVWAELCLSSHLSLLVSFIYYRPKKYLVLPFVGKLICVSTWSHSLHLILLLLRRSLLGSGEIKTYIT